MKPPEATLEGQSVATEVDKSHHCNFCGKNEVLGRRKFKQCSRCKSVRCCSASCQQSHWKQHKDLCKCIQQLSVSSSKNNVGLGDSEDDQVFVSHLTPKEKKTVAKLIGSKCLIHCHMNGCCICCVAGHWCSGVNCLKTVCRCEFSKSSSQRD